MMKRQKNKVSDFAKIRHLTTRRDKIILLFVLLPATFLLSLIETFAISVIMPFITLASSPELIFENKYARFFYESLGFDNVINFMVFFSGFLIVFYIFRAVYNVAYSYVLNRFAFRKYHFFAYRLFCKVVELSYIDFTNRDMDAIRRDITSESLKVSIYIQQMLNICAEMLTIALMYALLLFVSWKMTLVLTLFLLANIILIIQTISKNIQKQGVINAAMGKAVFSIISKALGNFKIIKLKGIQQGILNDFDCASKKRVDSEIKYQVLAPLPRFILESLGLCILIAAVAYILIHNNSAASVIAIISMYALALYRILPAISLISSRVIAPVVSCEPTVVVFGSQYSPTRTPSLPHALPRIFCASVNPPLVFAGGVGFAKISSSLNFKNARAFAVSLRPMMRFMRPPARISSKIVFGVKLNLAISAPSFKITPS